MKTVGKLAISIASLIIGIVIVLLVVPSQLHGAQQSNNQIEQSSPLNEKILNYTGPTTVNVTIFNKLNNETENILNECVNTTLSNSTTCIIAINDIKHDCDETLKPYLSYLPTCNDPRLQ